MPSIRIIVSLVSVPMLASLVLLNYHFVSDVIAGAFVGAIIAAYAVHLACFPCHAEPFSVAIGES